MEKSTRQNLKEILIKSRGDTKNYKIFNLLNIIERTLHVEETNENLYHKIIQLYQETSSVKETANKLGTFPIKVRRVLITEGLWNSNTSVQIGSLYARGLSVAEIAKQFFISEKNVQSYLPYCCSAN